MDIMHRHTEQSPPTPPTQLTTNGIIVANITPLRSFYMTEQSAAIINYRGWMEGRRGSGGEGIERVGRDERGIGGRRPCWERINKNVDAGPAWHAWHAWHLVMRCWYVTEMFCHQAKYCGDSLTNRRDLSVHLTSQMTNIWRVLCVKIWPN